MSLSAADIESIERATLSALAPRLLHEDDGWLIALDDGATGRANSVTVLRLGERALTAKVAEVEALYCAEGLKPQFRLAERGEIDPLRALLLDRGYVRLKPTSVQIADTATVLARLDDMPGQIDPAPDAAWLSVFTGEGFDPEDGASRARIWSRVQDATYASVREDGEAIAIGVASYGFGWAGVHGMRTLRPRRGEGLARRVLAALAVAAAARGAPRFFLQVEHDNPAAWALYGKAGFTPAWDYAYWRRPA